MFYEGRCWHLAFCFTETKPPKKHQTAQVIFAACFACRPCHLYPAPQKNPSKACPPTGPSPAAPLLTFPAGMTDCVVR